MNVTITEDAASLYINEMNLSKGDHISLFVRVGGVGSGGFSVGVYQGKPEKQFYTLEVASINFCITEDDIWYFDGLTVDFDHDIGDITFSNKNFHDLSNP